jgi:hypothetical protein
MADVTFGLTEHEITPPKWPPEISKPVNNEAPGNFVQVGEPISNDKDAKVHAARKPIEGKAPQPVNTVEVNLVRSGTPVSNDRSAVIHSSRTAGGTAAPLPPEGQPLPGTQIPNPDVQIMHHSNGGQPVSNDRSAATIYHAKPQRTDLPMQDPPQYESVPQPGAFISNERNVTFSGSPQRPVPSHEIRPVGHKNTHTTPTVNNSGDVFMGASAGLVSQGSTEVHIAQEGGEATFIPNTDVSIGGGGDNTKGARDEEVHFGATGRTVRK